MEPEGLGVFEEWLGSAASIDPWPSLNAPPHERQQEHWKAMYVSRSIHFRGISGSFLQTPKFLKPGFLRSCWLVYGLHAFPSWLPVSLIYTWPFHFHLSLHFII
jgi:hypothetical protein